MTTSLEKASLVLRWCIFMLGHPNETSGNFNDRAAKALSMHRHCYFWQMYREFCRNATIQEEAEGRRAASADAIHLPKFSYILEVLRRIDSVATQVHELVRILEHPHDVAIPHEVYSGAAHQSIIRCWSQDEHRRSDHGNNRGGGGKSDLEDLIRYLLECIGKQRYRKRGDVVYEEIEVDYGAARIGTHAWRPADFFPSAGREQKRRSETEDAGNIRTMVHRFCRKELREDMWSKFVNLKNKKLIYDYLEECEDVEFPRLCPQRNILAFRNGIFNTTAGACGEFYFWDSVYKYIGPEVVSAKYFDIRLDPECFEIASSRENGWWGIPTPAFQGILDYQNLGCPHPSSSSSADPTTTRLGAAISSIVDTYVEALQSKLIDVDRKNSSERVALLTEIERSTAALSLIHI